MKRTLFGAVAAATVVTLSGLATAQPLTTAFTYQARIRDAGLPANGQYDIQFRLFDASLGGFQVGPTITVNNASVIAGIRTQRLDFGPVYDGDRLWLQVSIRPGASIGAYTTVFPRQELTIAPHAGVGSEAVDIHDPGTSNAVIEIDDGNGGFITMSQDDGNIFAQLEQDFSAGGGAFFELKGPGSAFDTLFLSTNNNAVGGSQIRGKNADGDATFDIVGGGSSTLSPGGRGGGSGLPNAAQYNVLWPGSGDIVAQLTATSGGDTDDNGGALYMWDELTGNQTLTIEPDFTTGGGIFMLLQNPTNFNSVVLETTLSESPYLSLSGEDSFFAVNTDSSGNSAVSMASNAVSDFEILDEPGVANNQANGPIAITPGYASLISRSITVPTSGFVLVLAQGDIAISHVSGGPDCIFHFGVSESPTTMPTNGDVQVNIPSGAPSGTYDQSAAAHALFDVSAGTHTFYFIAQEFSGDSANMWDMQLTCVFFPTAYGTTVPTAPGDAGGVLGNDARLAPMLPQTAADIAAEQADAVAFDQWRKQSEMDQMRAEMAELRELVEQTRREQGLHNRARPAKVDDHGNGNNTPPDDDAPAVDDPVAFDGKE